MLFSTGNRGILEIGLVKELIEMRVYPMINVYFDFEPKEYDKNIPLKITHIIFFYNGFIKPDREYKNKDKVICKHKLKDNWDWNEDSIISEITSATFLLQKTIKEKLLKEEE